VINFDFVAIKSIIIIKLIIDLDYFIDFKIKIRNFINLIFILINLDFIILISKLILIYFKCFIIKIIIIINFIT